MKEDIKDIEEILELVKNELENQNKNTTAILDYEDLCSLKRLYSLYKTEKDLNDELQFRYQIEHTKYLDFKNDSIPKSKVKEKIEEIENTGIDVAWEQINYSIKEQDRAKIQVLQELLED